MEVVVTGGAHDWVYQGLLPMRTVFSGMSGMIKSLSDLQTRPHAQYALHGG